MRIVGLWRVHGRAEGRIQPRCSAHCTIVRTVLAAALCLLQPVTATTYFLEQSSQSNSDTIRDGLSLVTAFTDTKQATRSLEPGDTLEVVGTLTNPSYNGSYVFTGDGKDPHVWHGENTLAITVAGAAARGLPSFLRQLVCHVSYVTISCLCDLYCDRSPGEALSCGVMNQSSCCACCQ